MLRNDHSSRWQKSKELERFAAITHQPSKKSGNASQRSRIHFGRQSKEHESILSAERKRLESALQESQSSLSTLQAQLAEVKAELDAAKTTLTSTEEEKSSAASKLDKLTSEVSGLKKKHLTAKSSAEAAKKENAELRTQLAALRSSLESTQAETELKVETLRSELELAKSKLTEAKSSAAEKVEVDNKTVFSKDHVEDVIQTHELESSTLRSQIRKLEAQVFEETDKAHRATRKAIELEERLRRSIPASNTAAMLTPPKPNANANTTLMAQVVVGEQQKSSSKCHFFSRPNFVPPCRKGGFIVRRI